MNNFINISAAFSHRLLKFVLHKSLDIGLLFHGQNCKLLYLLNLRIHEYKKNAKNKGNSLKV